MLIAVETSDIVESTKLSAQQYEQVIAILTEQLVSMSQNYSFTFEQFRGDAFQITYKRPECAMLVLLLVRLRMMYAIEKSPIYLTQSLAIGKQTISNKMGPVYILSGRTLDKIKSGDLALVSSQNLQSVDLTLSTKFLHNVINGLTQKQAEVLFMYLYSGFTDHQTIADMLSTTRQNVSTHLARANAELVKDYLMTYENLILEQAAC